MCVWYIHTYLLYYIWNCRPEIVSFLHWLTFAFSFSLSENAQKYALEKAMATGNAISNANKPRVSLCVCVSVRVWHNEVSALVQKLSTWKLHVLQISKKAQAKAHTHTRTHTHMLCVSLAAAQPTVALYLRLSACKMRNSNANAQRN